MDSDSDFEYDANEEMLKLWDRDQILKEVEEEKIHIKQTESQYYDGVKSFKEIAKNMEPVDGENDNNVFIKYIQKFPDNKPITGLHNILYDSIGYLEFDDKPFESTMHQGKPNKLYLAEGPIILGLLRAILNMREGESANILIHPSMAYGQIGVYPIIPPDAVLYYYIKIHKIWFESELTDIIKYERENNVDFPIDKKLAAIEEHKQIANQFLRDGEVKEAVIRYKAAIKLLEEENQSEMLYTLLQNTGIALNKLEMYKSATKYLKRALNIQPQSTKAIYHIIKSRIGLKDYYGSLKWIEAADKIDPNDGCVARLKVIVDKNLEEMRSKKKEIEKNMAKAFN